MIKRFLNTILRFSLLPAITLLLMEISIGMNRKKLLSEQKMEKAFRHSGDEYQWLSQVRHPRKVLLMGSSSVKYGLSCTKLNELSHDTLAFFNLAANARDPIETYFILKHIDLTGVKTVCMGIDPWIYAKAYYKSRSAYMYLDMDVKMAVRYSLNTDPRTFPIRYKALLGSLLPVSSKKGTVQFPAPAGFGSGVLNRKPVNFNDSIHKKFHLEEYGWSDLQFEYLQKIASFCESKSIRFIAFYPPKRSDFITDYKNHCTAIHASFLSKLKEAGFNTPIAGSFDQLEAGNNSLFADAYHLNAKGQDLYSNQFFGLLKDQE